jgi:hypothetical protein
VHHTHSWCSTSAPHTLALSIAHQRPPPLTHPPAAPRPGAVPHALDLTACFTFKLASPAELAASTRGPDDDDDTFGLWVEEWDSSSAWRPWAAQVGACRSLLPPVAAVHGLYRHGSLHALVHTQPFCPIPIPAAHQHATTQLTYPLPLLLQEDPIKLLELDVVWEEEGLGQGAPQPQLAPAAASHWQLHVLTRGYSERERSGPLGLRPRERQRVYSSLARWGGKLQHVCQRV